MVDAIIVFGAQYLLYLSFLSLPYLWFRNRVPFDTRRSRVPPDTRRSRVPFDTPRSRVPPDTRRSRVPSGTRHAIIRIVVSVFFAYTLGETLNLVFASARPFVAEGFTPLVQVPLSEYYTSFPSGHAAIMAALAMSVYFVDRAAGVALFVGAVLTGVARVLAGVHYPVDIAGGFLLGIAVSFIIKTLHERYPIW
jgi:membrane-associated phospholipid phosphatase